MPDCNSTLQNTVGAVRFILAGEMIELHDVAAHMTVVQYLRETKLRSGTKESCAQGGCGACTVVLADLDDNQRLRYRAVNACLCLIPQLDGKALLTIEDLKSVDGHLHPIQQALRDGHASQCGYCTPGIVMSLYALYQSQKTFDRESIVHALTGNLCRCTGYRAIIDAAVRMADMPRAETDSQEQSLTHLLQKLRRMHSMQLLAGKDALNCSRYLMPTNMQQLLDMLQQFPDALLMAGGTDMTERVLQQQQLNSALIFLSGVQELNGVEESEQYLSIAAATPLQEAYPMIKRHFPAFAELLLRFASPAIRNVATLAGNIVSCSGTSDTLPVLIALGGSLELRQGNNTRRVELQAFHSKAARSRLVTAEFIEKIHIPLLQQNSLFSTYKLSKRQDCDIATLTAAFYLRLQNQEIQELRFCYSGLGSQVYRAECCENALTGLPWTQDTVNLAIRLISRELTENDDVRGSARYRKLLTGNLLQRFFLESSLSTEQVSVSDYQKSYAG